MKKKNVKPYILFGWAWVVSWFLAIWIKPISGELFLTGAFCFAMAVLLAD